MVETKEAKIFDEYEVDCNTCECYWDSSCDGVKCSKAGEESRKCTSYKAVRKIDVVERVLELESSIKSVDKNYWVIAILFMLHLVGHLIFG